LWVVGYGFKIVIEIDFCHCNSFLILSFLSLILKKIKILNFNQLKAINER
jgi:hypothetical protein